MSFESTFDQKLFVLVVT